MSAGGDPLTCEKLRERPQLAGVMKQSLKAVHKAGVVHGDVALHNFVLAANDRVWLLDFESSRVGDPSEQDSEMYQLESNLRFAGVV